MLRGGSVTQQLSITADTSTRSIMHCTLRKGGRYDGIMCIVLSILALKSLDRDKIDLPFSVEIMAFAD